MNELKALKANIKREKERLRTDEHNTNKMDERHEVV